MKKILSVIILLMLFPSIVFAHSGRTDANGGHHDYNNVSGLGDYHYHHGYGPHLHPDGVCPYDNSVSNEDSYTSPTLDTSSENETLHEEAERFGYVDGEKYDKLVEKNEMLKDRISTLKKNNRYYKYCLIAIVILAIIATRAAYKRGVQNTSNDIISPIPSQDAKTYIYCGVVFQSKAKVYHYRTNDTTIKEGDEVVVPVGKQQEEVIATVVSVGRYTAQNAPYPLNRTRFIIRKHND